MTSGPVCSCGHPAGTHEDAGCAGLRFVAGTAVACWCRRGRKRVEEEPDRFKTLVDLERARARRRAQG